MFLCRGSGPQGTAPGRRLRTFQHLPLAPGARKPGQRGYVILVILLMLALLTLAMVEAAPSAAVQVRRDQEEELVRRGDQYVRAIRRFYRKFGRYPTSLDELKDTNHLRFLRRQYKDPITGKDFKLLHIQDVNYQPVGFFGKSLTQGNNNINQNNVPNAFVNQQNPPVTTNPSDNSNPNNPPPTGDNTQPAGAPGTPPQSPQQSNNGLPVFGGGPIVGVSSTSPKASIKEINKKNHYNDWQFFYDPRMDLPIGQMFQPQNLNPGGNNPNGNINNPPPPPPTNSNPQ
ncbi:MAG TPA: hypothetical protein VK699_00520 [Terriglobales bacterium]|jgi:hypothetical protein|nr:hypothetical protein [Terriglobales bacterium]